MHLSNFETWELRLQSEMLQWVTHNFPGHSPLENTTGLAEEAGELCRAVLKLERGIRGTREEWLAEIKKEIGDVIICCIFIANDYGVDWAQALQERWRVIEQRDWQRDKIQHGVTKDDDDWNDGDVYGDSINRGE
jgi:NTP pyrophosphatase (non-canonical NTP hydrolase)